MARPRFEHHVRGLARLYNLDIEDARALAYVEGLLGLMDRQNGRYE